MNICVGLIWPTTRRQEMDSVWSKASPGGWSMDAGYELLSWDLPGAVSMSRFLATDGLRYDS